MILSHSPEQSLVVFLRGLNLIITRLMEILYQIRLRSPLETLLNIQTRPLLDTLLNTRARSPMETLFNIRIQPLIQMDRIRMTDLALSL